MPDLSQLHDLPSPFYRVVAKAIILDDKQRLLMVFAKDGNIELPGGGWEHDETFEECLQREAREELDVGLKNVSSVWFMARGISQHGWHRLLLLARADLESTDFKPGEEHVAARFVTKEEMLALPYLNGSDDVIKEYTHIIWPDSGASIAGV